MKLGFLSDEDVTNFLSRQYGVPAINLSHLEIDPAVVKLIPYETGESIRFCHLAASAICLPSLWSIPPTSLRWTISSS